MVRSLVSFLILYTFLIICLVLFKYMMSYPDYVIPGFTKIQDAIRYSTVSYALSTIKTFGLVITGHFLATFLALCVAVGAATLQRIGEWVKTGAYTLQAYPLIAIAPLLFILFGDGLPTQLIITVTICYFPMLLAILGVLLKPTPEVEHFFASSGRLTRWRTVEIRLLENLRTITTAVCGSASLAVVGAILAEYLAENSGIGYKIRIAQSTSRLDGILLALLTIGLVNWLYLGIIEYMANCLLKRWNVVEPSRRSKNEQVR